MQYISNEFVKAHPEYTFVFGDNAARYGKGGQAFAMRGEPNTIGVRTKMLPTSADNAYFSDDNFDCIKSMIDEDLSYVEEKLKHHGNVVFPSDGIGTGRAMMKEKCPLLFKYLQERIECLENTYGCKPIDLFSGDSFNG